MSIYGRFWQGQTHVGLSGVPGPQSIYIFTALSSNILLIGPPVSQHLGPQSLGPPLNSWAGSAPGGGERVHHAGEPEADAEQAGVARAGRGGVHGNDLQIRPRRRRQTLIRRVPGHDDGLIIDLISSWHSSRSHYNVNLIR